jgi:hypothetical protein
MLSILFINEYYTASLVDRKWTHFLVSMLLYINRSSLSHIRRRTMIWLFYAARLYLPKIHYLSTIKGSLFIFSLSLSFTHFTMINKKHASLLSAKIGTDSSNYGKIDTCVSINWYLYLLLLLLSTVNRCPSFICANNENVKSAGYHSIRIQNILVFYKR